MKALVLGCGSRKFPIQSEAEIITLDNNPSHTPDVLWDLTKHPLPFDNNEFNEIHAYDVLEHLASQSDYEFFFAEFSEYWRILKPDGRFHCIVPDQKSIWAFDVPSHKRIIIQENLIFLNQQAYLQVGITPISDFRHIYKANFQAIHVEVKDDKLHFVLEAKK